ncbi:MAG: PQQ-binding-like beta-propeller repeat protein [Halobacteriales archaeon]|nr:PQQ-binding-like beta-propeller repeat protein [Halobacteriales archaeon]
MRQAPALLVLLLLASAQPVWASLGHDGAPAPKATPGASGSAQNASAQSATPVPAVPAPPVQSLPVPTAGSANDWPAFKGGSDRTGATTAHLPLAPALRWQTGATANGGILASPVAAQGLIVFASLDRHVYAVDAASGLQHWRWDAGKLLLGTPALAQGLALVPVSDGRLVALDLLNGTERWTGRLNGTMSASPLTYNGEVIAASEAGQVVAFDLADGAVKWSRTVGPLGDLVSPALAGGRVIVGDALGTVWALHVLTGNVLWKAGIGSPVTATPAAGDGRIIVPTLGLKSLDQETGHILWTRDEGGPVRSSPAYRAGVIVVGGGDTPGIAGVNAVNGQRLWFVASRLFVKSAPIIAADQALAISDDGSLFAMTLRNGTLLWTLDAGERTHGSPALVNGKVVVGRIDGLLRVYGDEASAAGSGVRSGEAEPTPAASNANDTLLTALPLVAVLGGAYYALRLGRDRMRAKANQASAPEHIPLPPPLPKPGETLRMTCPRCACRLGVRLQAGEVATCPGCGLRSALRRKAAAPAAPAAAARLHGK